MASIDVAKLLNKITQDIPGINTVLKALAKWDVSALTDVPDGAMQATTDANNNLTIKKKVSGSYTPVAKLMHDVDKLDGYHASTSATANAIPVRNASGALPGNILGNAVTADTATALATGAVVPVNQGGTGATTASQARANLGVADGADFTTHVAKQASHSVEGHVKLDAFAADGSNTAAPGGSGLGVGATLISDWNTMLKPGWYASTIDALNKPINAACRGLIVCGANATNGYQIVFAGETNEGRRIFSRRFSSGVFAETWIELPNGITDSTSTTSSTIAASATAVKTAFDRAKQIATASITGGIKVGGAISSVSSDGTVTLRQASTSQRGDVQLSSSTTSSSEVTAATSLAVKTAYDKAASALGLTIPATTTALGIGRIATSADLVDGATINNGPAFLAAGSAAVTATTTSRGIGRVATSADLVDGATIDNGPAFLAAGSAAVTTTPTPNAVPKAGANGRLTPGFIPGLFVGDIRLLPFRAAALAAHCPGWHFCNGDKYALTSPIGSQLNALPTDFKADWGITVSGSNISIPNMFYSDGRGYFLRAVDGTTRQVGAIQLDEIKSHTHSLPAVMQTGSETYYGGIVGNMIGDLVTSSTGGTENRVLNKGMTPAIFLNV